jgi:hypothetical protein
MPVPSTPFFAEYSFNSPDQVILNIVNPDPANSASGYSLVVYLYNPDTHTASNYTAPIQAILPRVNYLVIDPEFYDLFDVTSLYYYNDEREFGGTGTAASLNVRTVGLAIVKGGQTYDTLGDPAGTTAILSSPGFLVRNSSFAAPQGSYLQTDYNVTDHPGWATVGRYSSPPPSTWLPSDTTPPDVSLLAPHGATAGASSAPTFDVTFTEDVTGVTANSFVLDKPTGAAGSITSVTQTDARHYVVRTAGLSGDGVYHVNLASNGGGVADLAGNARISGYAGGAYTLDQTGPGVVQFVPNGPARGHATTADFKIDFSEAVTGVAAGAFRLVLPTGGSGRIDLVTAVDSSHYIVHVADLQGDGEFKLAVAAGGGGITDQFSNPIATMPTSSAYLRDGTAPTLVSSVVAAGTTPQATSADFYVKFSEAVTGGAISSFTLVSPDGVSGTIDQVSAWGVDGYRVSVSHMTAEGAYHLDLKPGGGGITDLAGNAVTGSLAGTPVLLDAVGPQVTSVTLSGNPAGNADSAQFVVAFTEAVAGVTAASFELQAPTGGTGSITGISQVSATQFLVTASGFTGSGAFSVAALASGSGIVDTHGNPLTVGTPTITSFMRDVVRPEVLSAGPSGSAIGHDANVDFLVTFSEAVDGVDAGSFVLVRPAGGSGSITSVTATDASHYVVRVSGLAGDGEFRLEANPVSSPIHDLAGNPVAAMPASMAYLRDATSPHVVSIERAAGADEVTNASSLTFRVVFDEAVIGLSGDDFAVQGATGVISVKAAAAVPYGYDVQISGGDVATVDGRVSLALVATGGASDAAGNPLRADIPQDQGQSSYLLDHRAPTTALVDPVVQHGLDRTGMYGEGDTLRLTLSEPVATAGLDLADLSVPSTGNLGIGASLRPVVDGVAMSNAFILTLGSGASLSVGDTLTLSGAAVVDQPGNHPQTGVTFVLPGVPLAVTSIEAAPAAANAAQQLFTVTFTAPAVGVAATDFALVGTGVSGVIGTPVTREGGSLWDVPVTGLAGDGQIHLELVTSGTAIADRQGHPLAAGFTAGQVIAVDTIAPDTGALVAAPAIMAKSATAVFQLPPEEPGLTYQFKLDGAAAWLPLAVVDGVARLDGLADGPHDIAIRAVDTAGNADPTPTSYSWSVDTVTPTVSVVRLDSTVGAVANILNAGDKAVVAVTLSEDVTLPSGTTVELLLSNGVVLSTDVLGTDHRTLSFTYVVAPGADTAALSVTGLRLQGGDVTDGAGNPVSLAGAAKALGLGVDTVPPAIAFTTASGLIGDPHQILMGTGEAGRPVTVRDGSTMLGAALVAATGTWRLEAMLSGDGPHIITASETDRGGNAGQAEPITLILDTAAPSLTVNKGVALVQGGEAVRIRADLLAARDSRADHGHLVFKLAAASTLGEFLLDGHALAQGDTFLQSDVDAGKLSFAARSLDQGHEDVAFVLSDGVNSTAVTFAVDLLPQHLQAGATGGALVGSNGSDLIIGGPGADRIDGGPGIDTMSYAGSVASYRFALGSDGTVYVDGPEGKDKLSSIELITFADKASVDLKALLASVVLQPLSGSVHNGVVDQEMLDLYTGDRAGLQYQAVGHEDGEAIGGGDTNDFLDLRGGDDAANGSAGDDVIDSGTGSGFLLGGGGRDEFVITATPGQPSWSTIGDWTAGDKLVINGWVAGVSRAVWVDQAGAAGWEGATMHADLNNDGTYDVSVTWTGMARAGLPAPTEHGGSLWIG